MNLSMSREERESFLAAPHVGIVSVEAPGRAPLVVPIWYGYERGAELWIITNRSSRKGRLIEAAGRFALCAQVETVPYKYVAVEGAVASTTPSDVERDLRPMAHRYLGQELGDLYVAQTAAADAGDSVVIRMRPERWTTVDYAKQFGTA